MTHSDQTDTARLVGELHEKRPDLIGRGCQCSYCTSIRNGTAPPIPEAQSAWARRMGRPDTGRL